MVLYGMVWYVSYGMVWYVMVWYMVHGKWYMVHGKWYMVYGIWYGMVWFECVYVIHVYNVCTYFM